MHSWRKGLAALSAILFVFAAPAARADDAPGLKVARLAADVEKDEGVRAVKKLQNSYAQYFSYGLWDQMASLFADSGEVSFGSDTFKGKAAIGAYFLSHFGDGRTGLAPGQINTQLLMEQAVNVSADGKTAQGRWRVMGMLGRFGAGAEWTGGLFQNDYVKENGVWKIAHLHYYPQYAGPYESGWHNVSNDSKIIPTYFTAREAGIPVPPTNDDAGLSGARDNAAAAAAKLAGLDARAARLNDQDKVANLQNIYGYYVDRKMWDDVTDLFADDGVLELGGAGLYQGTKGIRRALEMAGPQSLRRGELNNHVQFSVTVTVSADGREAHARGVDLGILGDVDHGEMAQWSLATFDNRFIKQGGVWKIREMRLFPVMKTDFYQGWAKSRIVDTAPASDKPLPAADSVKGNVILIPAFFDANPVTGKTITAPKGMALSGGDLLPRAGDARAATVVTAANFDTALTEAKRKLAVSIAYDATENLSAAFGTGIDDYQWQALGDLFSEQGNRGMPNTGLFTGPAKIAAVETSRNGGPRSPRTNLGPHIMVQPVIDVAHDGRSARFRVRLFQLGSSVDRPGSIGEGMYPNNQAVLENGAWKMWSLNIDEFYYNGNLTNGWSKIPPRPAGAPAGGGTTARRNEPAPDYPNAQMGRRISEGADIGWPGIKPMWFHYKNPVSGREPEYYWPDCASCVSSPNSSATAHGYPWP